MSRPFLRQSFQLFSGTLIAQITSVLSTFLLAKYLYAPAAFGVLSVLLSLAAIVSTLSTFRYESLIVLPESDHSARVLLQKAIQLSAKWIAIAGLIGFSYFLFFQPADLNLLFFLLFPLLGFLLAWMSGSQNWLTRFHAFGKISWSKVIQALSIFAIQALLGFWYPEQGLLIGNVGGVLVASLFLYYWMGRDAFVPVEASEVARTLQTYRSMIRYLMPSTGVNLLYLNLQPILIAALFGKIEAGLFYFAVRCLQAPLQLLSSSVSQVYYKHISELYRTAPGKMFVFTLRVSLGIGLLISLPLMLVWAYAGDLILFFFGEKWSDAGAYLSTLTLLFLAQSMYNPISFIAETLNRIRIELWFNVYFLLEILFSLWLGYEQGDFMVSIRLMAILGAAGYFGILLYFLGVLYLFRTRKTVS